MTSKSGDDGLSDEWLGAFLGSSSEGAKNNKKNADKNADDVPRRKMSNLSPSEVYRGGWNRDTGCPVHAFSLVVCRHPWTKLWLAVNETKGRGWWLPGGFVECGDDHFETAVKETKEEAGIDVILKGVLRIENSITAFGGRQRVVFYAEPKDLKQEPKDTPDEESQGAKWMSLDELREKGKLNPPKGLRGTELLDWANYLDRGGTIYPLDVLAAEETPVPIPDS